MAQSAPIATTGTAFRIYVVGGVFLLALAAAWGFPQLDRALNPSSANPGLISFLGVGLSVLTLTVLLLFAGLRAILPRTGVFLAAAFGYNALLVLVKFGLGPLSLYAANESGGGFFVLTNQLAYPGLAAITAVLYGMAFVVLYAIFHSRLQRKLGISVALEARVVQLVVIMFILAVVGGITLIGLGGFLEYASSVLFASVIGILIAIALVGAVILCAVAFREARDEAVMLRNVSLFTTFAWVGLAFIAAYHILWLVFLLTLVSLWPLRAWNGK